MTIPPSPPPGGDPTLPPARPSAAPQPSAGSHPPPGGYPPPPPLPGGYPPPPWGGYPPPASHYPPGYAARSPFDVGSAFSWAWNKFTKNVAALVVPAIAYAAILLVIFGAFYAAVVVPLVASDGTGSCAVDSATGEAYCSTPDVGVIPIVVLIVGAIVLLLAMVAIQSAYLSGILAIADGREVSIGDFFKPRNFGSLLLAGSMIGLAAGIGGFCIVGGIVVAVFTLFVPLIVLDRNVGAIAAIKASIDLVKKTFGDSVIAYLLSGFIVTAGVLVCFVGVLVSGPIAQLFTVYAYRALSGGRVAPLTP